MCFSAQASFAAGAVLLPASGYCLASALRRRPRFLLLAMMPFAFGIQQFSEGVVWLGLEHDHPGLVESASAVYLYFAIPFWPFWVALSLFAAEERKRQRGALAVLVGLSLVWFWVYYPIAASPQGWLSIEIVHHSVHYDLNSLPAFHIIPRRAWRLLYLTAICLPLALGGCDLVGTRTTGLLAALLVSALFVVSSMVYWYAFTSVWCFFSAILSLLLCVVFYRLPSPNRHTRQANRPGGQSSVKQPWSLRVGETTPR